MTLIADAENAEDIADVLTKFKTPLPEHAQDITASISALYAIGSHFRGMFAVIVSGPYKAGLQRIQDDLDLVGSILHNTLHEILRILGDRGHGSSLLADEVYRQIWNDIAYFFELNGQVSLRARLVIYRNFIVELAKILKGRPPKTSYLDTIRDDILLLATVQDPAVNSLNRRTSSAKAPLSKPRSWERDRPSNSNGAWQPSALQKRPYKVAEEPISPCTTSPSSSTDRECKHWAFHVFQALSKTPLTWTGEASRCYDEPAADLGPLLRDFKSIFGISFDGQSTLTVRVYHRRYDDRARIVCSWPRNSGGNSNRSCLPLKALVFRRVESSLEIFKKRPKSSKLDLWANLVFTTIERMILVYCTLLALRENDSRKPTRDIQDYELSGEVELMSGRIADDCSIHMLQIYRDGDSQAIRLQASPHDEDMKRAPTWTAFITDHISSPSWLRRVAPTVIYLRELRHHVFSPNYQPQMTALGEYILCFVSENDTEAFVRTIDDLSALYARPSPTLPPPPPPPPNHWPQQPFFHHLQSHDRNGPINQESFFPPYSPP